MEEIAVMTSRLLPDFWESFDRLFEGLPRRLALGEPGPALNVWEEADAFHVEAEVPGLTKDQLHIEVTHRDCLTLSAQRAACDGDCRWHRRERGQGSFQRTIKLPAPVDAGKVSADLKDGVLTLTLPKAEEARPRRIAVNAN
jgi:HSP20 family protein